MDTDKGRRDQASKASAAVSAVTAKLNGKTVATRDSLNGKAASVAERVSTAVKSLPSRPRSRFKTGAGLPFSTASRPLALTYIGIAVAALLFVGACGPVLSPKGFNQEKGLAAGLKEWSPLPQGGLLVVLLGLVTVASMMKTPTSAASTDSANSAFELPAGVTVNDEGVLCDKDGLPLPRGFRLSPYGKRVTGATGAPLPKGCVLGPGGVLLHSASGRPVPHSCGIGEQGVLLSSTGEALPDSMSVGPNSTLVAADGTVLSPDLQPVPAGFSLSGCGKFLIRPNGKPVPQGVHVGPGFRLLKPTGDNLPDGVKIGPCGTIICLNGTILGCDGAPLPAGFALNADKTVILDPQGIAVGDKYSMGPNGTMIDQDGTLLTALGRNSLCEHFALGPLGNLLMRGQPVPAAAYFQADGQLVGPDGAVLNCPHND